MPTKVAICTENADGPGFIRRLHFAASIGIGGHLAMPPLPHHRAYGSVPRRFGGLSGSHLLQGEQPHLLQAGFGKGAVQGAGDAESPWPFGAEDGRTGRLLPDTETSQFLIAPAPRLPLDPGDA